MDFGGTTWVTAGMLLAALYLACWDLDRVWTMGAAALGASRPRTRLLDGAVGAERVGWVVGAAAGVGLFLVTRGFLPGSVTFPLLGVGVAAVIAILAGWAAGARRAPTPSRPPTLPPLAPAR